MMLSWDDAAEPAPWGLCNVCLSTVFLTKAARPPLENRTYLAEFWTFAYAREAKFGRTEYFLQT